MDLDNGDELAAFAPGVLRYPGGTVASYWDWRAGRLTMAEPLPARYQHWNAQQKQFRLEEFQKLRQRCSADASFVLNMLSSDLDDQLNMLRAASALGIPITYVELGNEFFLGGIGQGEYARAFPTAAEYARVADRWARAIRLRYPDTQIAAVLAVEPGFEARQRTWNSVVGTLRSVDGFVLHDYVDSGLEPAAFTLVQPPRSLRATEQWREHRALQRSGGIDRIMRPLFAAQRERTRYLAAVTARFATYHTEFSMEDRIGAVAGTWAHGLFVAAQAAAIALIPNARTGIYHSFASGSGTNAVFTDARGFAGVVDGPVSVPGARSAAGASLGLLMRAGRNATRLCDLQFSPHRSAADSEADAFPSLVGLCFSGAARNAIVVNLSASSYHLRFPDLGFDSVEQLSGNPGSYIGSDSSLTRTFARGRLSAAVLPPYSISAFSGKPA